MGVKERHKCHDNTEGFLAHQHPQVEERDQVHGPLGPELRRWRKWHRQHLRPL